MDEQTKNIVNQSPKQFLASYDQFHKNRDPFHKTHSRITFLVRNDLMQDLKKLCKHRYGFKTKFINYAIERTLTEMNSKTDVEVASSEAAGRELSLDEVKTILDDILSKSQLNQDGKAGVHQTVMTTLFPGGAKETSLFDKELNGRQYPSPVIGKRGVKRYKTPEKCVKKYVEDCVTVEIKKRQSGEGPPRE